MFSRGDIVAVRFPFSDGSNSKLRPALVLSNTSIDRTGDVVLVMITASTREADVVVELTDEKLTEGLPKKSYEPCHRLFAIDQTLLLAKISSATESCMKDVLKTIVSIIS